MITPDISELAKSIHIKNEEFCRNKYPEFTEFIINKYPDKSHIERLYLFAHPEVSAICPVCGNPTKFINFNKGYSKYCSPGCASKDPNVKKQKVHMYQQHFGVSNPSQSIDIVNKRKNTLLEKYGNKNYNNRELAKKTLLEKYGVENIMALDNIRQKIVQTNIEKYGIEWPLSLDSIKEKANITYAIKYGGRGNASPILKSKMKKTLYDKYGDEKYNNRTQAKETMLERYGELAYHHYCIPKDTNIEKYVQNILDEYNIKYICNNRTILDGKELDIYIPERKLAIEINGCHWHSIEYKTKTYHYEKYMKCIEQGIQLLTLWDDQINRNPELVKSIILSKLGIFAERIYARKCEIREVSSKDSLKFLSLYHLQGAVNSGVRLGLYYNNKLVSIMTFGKKRKSLGQSSADREWELYRYCNILNTQVIGGASRLLKYFINKYKPSIIESFSSNDISSGLLYKSLSFNKISDSISYWYIKDNKRYHRFSFTKKRLIEMGYDPTKTEKQIMKENRYECIYDSGQTKWILNISAGGSF